MTKRIVAGGFATLALLVVGAGTASADPPPPPMTHDFAPTGCNMTHDCPADMTHD
ncbi:hypothetical protein [Flindersiella endophytica]